MTTILVVDDHPTNRQYLTTLLGYRGYRVLEAGDGSEGLERARAERPDLVIADLVMPTMDGFEFVRRLRADPVLAATPVIFYSATYDRGESRRLAEAGGVIHRLSKPADPEVILEAVGRALAAGPVVPTRTLSEQEFDREHLRMLTDKLVCQVTDLETVNARLEAEVARRVRVEESLRASEERFRRLVLNSSDIITVLGADGTVRFQSSAFAAVLGYSPEEWIGRNVFHDPLIHPEDFAAKRDFLKAALASPGAAVTGEFRLRHANGSWRYIEAVGQRLTDETGAAEVVASYRDTTARRDAEDRLAQEMERTRSIVDNVIVGVLSIDERGTITTANAAIERLFGHAAADLIGRNVSVLMPEPDHSRHDDYLSRYLRTGEARILGIGRKVIGHRKDGTTFPLDLSVGQFRLGEVRYFTGVVRDLSGQKQAEAGRRDSEARLRAIVDGALDGIITIDERGTIETVNPATAHLFGYAADELTGRNVNVLMPAPYHGEHDRYLANYRETGVKQVIGIGREVTGLRKDGSTFPAELDVSEVRLEDRRIFSGVVRDITARKQAEEALRLSEERFREAIVAEQTAELRQSNAELRRLSLAVAHTDSAVILADIEGRVVWVNPAFGRLCGYTLAEVAGRTPGSFLQSPSTDPATVRRMHDLVASRERFKVDVLNCARDGREYWVNLEVVPVTEEEDGFAGFVGIASDLTARKAIEQELREAKDNAEAATRAKADFLAAMSHEIRTPMHGVIGATGLLMTTALSAEQGDLVKTIRDSGNALLSLINDILDVSRIEAGKFVIEDAPFNLRHVAEEAVGLIAPAAFAKGLEPVTAVPPALHGWYSGDAGRITQVLVNLLANAVKFTPDGGEVVLSASAEPAAEGTARVRLAVRDTGIGIPHERQAAIFERFTQAETGTARRFGGTGLGLTICKSLTELMGGVIEVESEPGRGSTFRVELTLPVCPDPADGGPDTDRLSGRRVLIADGCPTVRGVLSVQLGSWGALAVEASNAADTLRCLRSAGADDPFAVALLDAWLPGAGAQDLAGALAADPCTSAVPLVLLGSVTLAGSTAWNRTGRFAAILAKPVRTSSLYNTLMTVLSGGAQAGDQPGAGPTPSKGFEGTRVLVVEDNPTNQKIALLMLDRLGCVADAVGDGQAAVDLLGRVSYDLILMDVQMPGTDGFEATAGIRRRELAAGVGVDGRLKVVAMTANALRGDRERCLAAGMDDYLSKPVTLDKLAGTLAKWRLGGTPPAAALPVGFGRSAGGPVPFRPDRLAEITGGNPALEPGLINCFLDDAQVLLSKVKAALDEADVGAVRAGAHGLFGMCRMFGTPALGETASEIEHAAIGGDLAAAGQALDGASRHFEEVRSILRDRLARPISSGPRSAETSGSPASGRPAR